jgi:uncharacterized repeat protein (TIGR01451 family)
VAGRRRLSVVVVGVTTLAVAMMAGALTGSRASAAGPAGPAGSTWTWLQPATSPSARVGAAMAYDAATKSIVLFGGGTDTAVLGETWTWDGTNWTQASPATSPPPRDEAAMAYDADTGQLVLFGGSASDRTALTDTWTWDGTNWTQATPATSPPASAANGTMAYDPATHQTLLVGGYHDDFTVPTDTWSWNGSDWTDLAPASNPSTRRAMSIDYDQATGQLVLFGGMWSGNPLHDTFTWDGSTWKQVTTATDPAPSPMGSMVYDAATTQLVHFGGYAPPNGVSWETWVWDGTGWASIAVPSAPSDRRMSSMAYDPATGQAILFGGFGGLGGLQPLPVPSGMLSDTWNWGTPGSTSAAVSVTLTASPADGTSVVGGGVITYTLAVTNKGSGPSGTVSVGGGTPAGTSYSNPPPTCDPSVPCAWWPSGT